MDQIFKNKNRILLVVLLVLGGVYVFYLKELFFFNNVMKSKDPYEINSYIKRYPNGRYIYQASKELEKICYNNVRSQRTPESVRGYYSFCPNGMHMEDVAFIELSNYNSMTMLRNFMHDYPNTKYGKDIKKIEDDLWEFELKAFEENIVTNGANPTSKNVITFRNLLNYMKLNKKYQIYVSFDEKVKLKDFSEFSAADRQLLKTSYIYEYDLPNENNVYSLKGNFNEEGVEDLEKMVFDNIKTSFEANFTKDFFEFEFINSSKPRLVEKSDILINISYLVTNKLNQGLPNLWQHTTSRESPYSGLYSNNRVFNGYLLGIETKFSFQFTIPSTQEKFAFNAIGEPGEHISNIKGFDDAYHSMVANTFNDFIDDVVEKLGL